MRRVDVSVLSSGKSQEFRGVKLPLELGRQRQDDNDWLRLQNLGSHHRIAIAPLRSVGVPREAIRVEGDEDGLKLINIHSRSSFYVGADRTPIKPGQKLEAGTQATIAVTDEIEVQLQLAGESMSGSSDHALRTLDAVTQSAEFHDSDGKLADLLQEQSEEDRIQVAVSLVRQALAVVQKAAGSDEYFLTAVRSAATMIELDRAFVLLYQSGEWRVRAKFSQQSNTSVALTDSSEMEELPSGSGLLRERVLNTKKTVIYEPNSYMHTTGSSMMALDRAVAAPMLDESGELLGVLYGDRKFDSDRSDRPIGELEATLLEVIAGAVATGLARQRAEELRASMSQFFSPSVADRLEQDENLLSAREADVTVLFCDIRGFSSIAERFGPARTIEWINDILTELSLCVHETDGVLVDYVGDELMAMWGAPSDQPDHAALACLSAKKMLGKIEMLRQRWKDITPDRFGFGIGINSGTASVGNTGSQLKFKYGPLGNVVNIASRIQGMTKRFGVPAIISQSTEAAVRSMGAQNGDERFKLRRLADVRPLGVREVVTIYELNEGSDEIWDSVRTAYEQALEFFDNQDLTGAARELATLVHTHPDDAPSVQLLGRVVTALTKNEEQVPRVIEFRFQVVRLRRNKIGQRLFGPRSSSLRRVAMRDSREMRKPR